MSGSSRLGEALENVVDGLVKAGRYGSRIDMARDDVRRDPARPPIRPGEVLREDVLTSLDLPVSTAARHLGVTRQALHRVLSGRAAISPGMALRIGKLCGNGPQVWLRLQVTYDLWHAERSVDVARIPTLRVASRAIDDRHSIARRACLHPSYAVGRRHATR